MNHDKVLIRATELHAANLGTVRPARKGFGCYTAWSGKVAVTVIPGETVEHLLAERDRAWEWAADRRELLALPPYRGLRINGTENLCKGWLVGIGAVCGWPATPVQLAALGMEHGAGQPWYPWEGAEDGEDA